jgi:formamidopyrimidine-DNA glycosylase
MLHLGMSGMLRVLPPDALIGKHDHVGIVLESTTGQRRRVLRFTELSTSSSSLFRSSTFRRRTILKIPTSTWLGDHRGVLTKRIMTLPL